jgi:hypothetical protein
MTSPSYTIQWKNSSGTVKDITPDILTVPLFSDTGSGEANTAVIRISAAGGKYITDGNPINDFDRMKITSDDGTGLNSTFTNSYQVKRRIPTGSKGGGAVLEVHLVGFEWRTQARYFSDSTNTFSIDSFHAAKLIQDDYNAGRGSDDPEMLGLEDTLLNNLPTWVFNNFNFGLNEETHYNRIMEIIDKNAAPVNEGGVFDFFELQAVGDMTLNNVRFFIFSSGKKGAGVLVDNTSTVNVGPTEGGLDTLKGTVINAWGDTQSGSLKTGFSKFIGGEQAFNLFPQFDSSVTYPVDALVTYNNALWKLILSNPGHVPPGHNSYWSEVTKGDYYGNQYIYSEFTKDQVEKWQDCGSDLDNSVVAGASMGIGFFDGNLVVDDGQMKRTWVDISVNDPSSIPSTYLYASSSAPNRFYPGLRNLIKGDGTGIWSGNDKNGVPFKNAIIEYQDDNLGWLVKKSAETNMVCAVIKEGQCYVFNDVDIVANGWGSIVTYGVGVGKDLNALDCFHPYDSLVNDYIQHDEGSPGFAPNPDPHDIEFTANQNSAIKVTYSWNLVPILETFPVVWGDYDWYKAGFWFNFRFPFPPNFINEPGGVVGGGYGSNTVLKGPSFLDINNMTYSSNGLTGYSNGLSTEDLGPISSIDFLIRIRSWTQDFGTWIPTGDTNFNVRVIVYDRNDNVAIQDKIVPFNDLTTALKYPVSGFQIYEARKPLGKLLDIIIPPVAVSPVNIFEWRHVKQIVICSGDSYDGNGRFNPGGGRWGLPSPLPFNIPPNIDTNHKLDVWIDAFRFTKPLLVNSETESVNTRIIEAEFLQKDDVTIYQQLKGLVKEEYQRAVFPHDEFDFTTTLAHDISFGDFFYLKESRLVNFSEYPLPGGGFMPNTIKLVCKRIEYSYTKPSNGEGGALRRIIGIRRFPT